MREYTLDDVMKAIKAMNDRFDQHEELINKQQFQYNSIGDKVSKLKNQVRFNQDGDDEALHPYSCSIHKRGLLKLIDLLDNNQVSWEEFSMKIRQLHKEKVGLLSFRQVGPTQLEEENFYANPYPGCICDKSI
ncbi:Protein FRIABLE 1 [Bienertia sinuspersici]